MRSVKGRYYKALALSATMRLRIILDKILKLFIVVMNYEYFNDNIGVTLC
jgi:hypothetical protein